MELLWIIYNSIAVKIEREGEKCRIIELRKRRIYGKGYYLGERTVECDKPIANISDCCVAFTNNGAKLFETWDINHYFRKYYLVLTKGDTASFTKVDYSYSSHPPKAEIVGESRLIYAVPKHWDWKWVEPVKYIRDGEVVLDYGCGKGDTLREIMRRRKVRGIGIDILPNVKGFEYYNNPDVIPMEDDSVDVVLCLMSLHHIKDYDRRINDMLRVLKPGGIMIIKEHDVTDIVTGQRADALHRVLNDNASPPVGYWSREILAGVFNGCDITWYYEDQRVEYGNMTAVTRVMPDGLSPIWLVNHEEGTRMSRVSALSNYISEMNTPRFNKLAVYAFPASGKTTWISKVQKSVGYKPTDTDDYLKIFDGLSDTRKFHELAFVLSSVYNADTPNIVVTNYHAPLFMAYLRKLGFTLVGVKLEDSVWEKRFSERKDLQSMNMPWAKWRKEVNYNQFDIVVKDFDQLDNLIYTPTQIIGYGEPMDERYRFLQSPLPFMSDDGHYVRKSVMEWIKRRGKTYVGLGDEIESVLDAEQVGVKARHTGLPESTPFDRKGEEALNKISRENLFDVELANDEIGVSLWAISNAMNPQIDAALRKLENKGGSYILMYPILNTARTHPYGYGGDHVDSMSLVSLRGTNGDRVYRDSIADYYKILGKTENWVCMNLLDFLAYINHDVEGTYVGPEGRFYTSRTNYRNYLWGVIMSKHLYEFPQYQTWWNSQTHTVRLISVPIRRYLAMDGDSLHRFRRLAAKSIYPNCTTILDERVTCYIMQGNKKYWIAVSGHIANLLMYSSVNLIDWVRYMDCVEENVRMYSQGGRLETALKMLLGKELLAEDNNSTNIRRLWHSYKEFELGVATYILLGKALRLPFNAKAVWYILNRLKRILKKYPKFNDMGWQGKERAKIDP